jgi:manganese transport protein
MNDLAHSVDIRTLAPGPRRLWHFLGPAGMISVGYMDPGNWATDLSAGARFGYQLLWVLVVANLIAMVLQTLAARLGIVTGRDLAQSCREHYARPVVWALWLLCELAIIACDLAEILGGAIALNLLFNLPLAWGALLTGLDALLIIGLQRYGIRTLEAVMAVMVLTIGACVGLNVFLASPDWPAVASGLIPQIDGASLYLAIGMLGATVMPHNLYLHSALVCTRRIESTPAAQREAIRYNFFDTAVALNLAFLINAAILVVSAATFFSRGIEVTELSQAYDLLTPLLGSAVASTAFAIALLVAGQSSAVTGTLAGQIVMEGFLRLRLSPVKRRLLTRLLAVVPAVAVLAIMGEGGVMRLLVLSQVVLSLQLPFAIVPLIRFTNDASRMGSLVIAAGLRRLTVAIAVGITGLNGWLVWLAMGPGSEMGAELPLWRGVCVVIGVACAGLLVWITVVPLRQVPASRR